MHSSKGSTLPRADSHSQLASEVPKTMAGTILIADDSETDVMLIKAIFRSVRLGNPVQIVTNGNAVLEYLTGTGGFADRERYPMPILLLLDLRMPMLDGFEVLQKLQARAKSRPPLAIVVLTGLSRLGDIRRAYQLGADSFLTKPLTMDEFKNMCVGLKGMRLSPAGENLLLEYQPVTLL